MYSLFGAAVFWIVVNPPWKIVAQHYSGAQWLLMVLFSITSMLIPFSLYFTGLQHLDATRAIVTACLEPVWAILLTAMFWANWFRHSGSRNWCCARCDDRHSSFPIAKLPPSQPSRSSRSSKRRPKEFPAELRDIAGPCQPAKLRSGVKGCVTSSPIHALDLIHRNCSVDLCDFYGQRKWIRLSFAGQGQTMANPLARL